MTLKGLIDRAVSTGRRFTSAEIPVKLNGKDIDVEFDVIGDGDLGYEVNMVINCVKNEKGSDMKENPLIVPKEVISDASFDVDKWTEYHKEQRIEFNNKS